MIPKLLAPFFVDPLSVKELSGIARRWQTYVGRGLYIGLIAIIIWIFWSSMMSRGSHLSPSAFAELSHSLFVSFVILQMIVSTLGGMSAGSDMITRELRNGTLGILALTPLSNWRIAAGKWKAALVQTTTGVLCSLPVFAVCAYLGGIGLWEFAYSFTLSLDCAAFGAAIGLFCSTVFRTGYVASTVSIIFLLLCMVPNLLFAIDFGNESVLDFLCRFIPCTPRSARDPEHVRTAWERRPSGGLATVVISLQIWFAPWWQSRGSARWFSGRAAAGERRRRRPPARGRSGRPASPVFSGAGRKSGSTTRSSGRSSPPAGSGWPPGSGW